MNREEKAAVVEEIAGQIGAAEAVYAVDYRGISVSQVADLRAKLRDADASFRIVKNSLTELAADQAGMTELKPLLEGPTALTLVRGDAALAAKALNDTARQLQGILDFKGGLLNGNVLSAEEIRSIARLPAREVLYAQLVGTVAAPISGLVRTLNALIAGIAIQLQAIADQGLVSGEAPVGAEGVASPSEALVGAEEVPPSSEATRSDEPAAEAEPEATRVASADDATPSADVDEQEPSAAVEADPEPEATAEAEAAPEEPQAEQTDEPEQDAASDADESDA